MLVLNFPAFDNKNYTAYDRFHVNGPYGEIPTKKEPIRTLGFALPYNNNYLITESEVVTGKSQTEALPYWPSDSEVNTVGRGLRFSRNDRTVEVIKLFIIWLTN